MPIPKPNNGETENDFKKEDIFVLTPRKTENRGMYLARCSNNGRMRRQFPQMKERMSFCLNSFNEYYKYWSKIEMSEVPSNTALGDCIAREKSKGFDYKEAYARCATKVGNKPLGAGGQINLEEDLLVEPVAFQEMNILGYLTKYFYLCPGAQETFKHLMEMGVDDETAGMIRTAAQVADNIFKIEAEVLDKKKATNEELNLATILVQDFKDIIEEIDEETGMIHDVSYMNGHIDVIKKYI